MTKSRFVRLTWRLCRLLLLLYFGLMLFVFLEQRKMIYQPAKGSQESMSKLASERGFEPWQNERGQFIGWKHITPLKSAHGRLLIVHGNSGCAIDRTDYADPLQLVLPMDVYILEYPGYGAREGSPSQESFFDAARQGFELLKKDGSVYIMGESLGTGVAAYLAGTFPADVAGVLLIAPYDSLIGPAQTHMPIFPVSLLLKDRFPSAAYLEKYNGPVAMLFAGQDQVVPNRFGHRLYDGYHGPKKFLEIPTAGHNDLLNPSEIWWRELVAFWKENATHKERVTATP